jgi:hypothetical protein
MALSALIFAILLIIILCPSSTYVLLLIHFNLLSGNTLLPLLYSVQLSFLPFNFSTSDFNFPILIHPPYYYALYVQF